MARDDHDILSFGVADTVRYFRLGDAVRPDLCKVSVNTISARVVTHISNNGLDTEADLEKALLHANVSPDHGQCELKRSCDEEDIKSLAGTMSHSDDEDFVSRLICLSSDRSFAPLNITKNALRILFVEYKVQRDFMHAICSFHQKIANVEEAYCSPFQWHESMEILEYFYVLKYPEETHRPNEDAWSIRQTALYHQIRRSDGRSTFILVSPYPDTVGEKEFTRWMRSSISASGLKYEGLLGNFALFDAYLAGWRPYLEHYEDKIEHLSMRMIRVGLKHAESVTAEDLASLNYIETRLTPVESILSSFELILDGLERSTRQVKDVVNDDTERDRLLLAIQNYRNQVTAYRINANAILRKCATASKLLDGILVFNNQNTTQKQSQHVLYLTKSTVDDSVTVRVITTITLVFLSCTAVSAIFAMPLFYLDDARSLKVSSSVWLYVVVVLPLTALTLMYWRWSLARKRKKRESSMV